jgi:hypothetical protein
MLLSKQYLTNTNQGCNLAVENSFVTYTNVTPLFLTDQSQLGNPIIFDPDTSNATIALAPNETGFVILRTNLSLTELQQLVSAVAPVVVAHAANVGTATPPATLAITSNSLPNGITGQTYSPAVGVFGGKTPYNFTIPFGALPPGIQLNAATGSFSGSPSNTGAYSFTVQVTDSSPIPNTFTRQFNINIYSPLQISTASLPSGIVGTTYVQSVPTTGGSGANYVWSATGMPAFLTIDPTSGTISSQPGQTALPGTYSVRVTVSDPGPPAQTASQSLSLTFTENTTVTIAVSPNPTQVGAPVTVAVTVVPTVSGNPTGSVTVKDATGAACTATLTNGSGSCQMTPLTVSAFDTVTATYPGDGLYNVGSGTTTLVVMKRNSTTTVRSAPNPSTLGQAVTVSVTVAPSGGGPVPTGTVAVTDTTGASCSIALTFGAGSCFLTPKTGGADIITANYAGDGIYNGSSASTNQQQAMYKFTGFFTPLGPAGTYSGALNLGKAVPVKWTLTDFNGTLISSLSTLTKMTAFFNGAPVNGTCAIVPAGSSLVLYSPTSGAAGKSTFRFSTNQFVFNWDTSSADPFGKGCFTLLLQMNDGSSELTSLQLQ